MSYHPLTEKIKKIITDAGREFETFEHEPVRTSEEASRVRTGYNIDQGAKSIIVRVRKPGEGKVFAMFVLVSVIFVWYHSNAKGVVDNVSLLITFIFSMISLEMIRRTKEMESATYLHIFNNLLYIIPCTLNPNYCTWEIQKCKIIDLGYI